MRVQVIALAVVVSSGCAAYRVDVLAPARAEASPPGSPIFIEPFSENTAVFFRPAMVRGYYGRRMYYPPIAEKPVLARPPMLRALHEQALAELQSTPGYAPTRALLGAPPPEDVVVARLTVLDQHVVDTNAGVKGLACGFGFLFPPFWIYDAFPVETDERFSGELQLFKVPAPEVHSRLASLPGLPDPVFNMQGLRPFFRQPFETTIHVERGYLVDEPPPVREQVMLAPVAHFLAGVIQSATRGNGPAPGAAPQKDAPAGPSGPQPTPAPDAKPAAPAPAPATPGPSQS